MKNPTLSHSNSSCLFITFEGLDGCGKTTQLKMLEQWFHQNKYEVQCTRQPGGTTIGKHIRSILLDPDHIELISQSELLLYLADRVQHIHEMVLPALEKGKVVLCDRFHDATVAYQGYGRGLDLHGIQSLVEQWITPYFPHFTVLLEITPETSIQRLKQRQQSDPSDTKDRLEKESINFFQKVANGYTILAENDPERFIRVDASKSIEILHEEIVQILLNRIENKK